MGRSRNIGVLGGVLGLRLAGKLSEDLRAHGPCKLVAAERIIHRLMGGRLVMSTHSVRSEFASTFIVKSLI